MAYKGKSNLIQKQLQIERNNENSFLGNNCIASDTISGSDMMPPPAPRLRPITLTSSEVQDVSTIPLIKVYKHRKKHHSFPTVTNNQIDNTTQGSRIKQNMARTMTSSQNINMYSNEQVELFKKSPIMGFMFSLNTSKCI